MPSHSYLQPGYCFDLQWLRIVEAPHLSVEGDWRCDVHSYSARAGQAARLLAVYSMSSKCISFLLSFDFSLWRSCVYVLSGAAV
jgi:hypothetical protein